tara:strand:- start:501 stop:977 length:477 start_codon:yes stop_codon:yes gene_type:complete
MVMIIACPFCEKKFSVVDNLIPDSGRLLKCGACNETWFFNKNDPIIPSIREKISITENPKEKLTNYTQPKTYKEINKTITNIPKNKGSELIKYSSKSGLTITKILSYIIILLISFIGLIILLDTFKNPLNIIFPNLELFLYNLFETLKDLFLFAKDLK